MTLEEKRDRDRAYQRERRARARAEIPPPARGGGAKVAQLHHPTRAPEADLPSLSTLFDLLAQASAAAERRGLRLLFSLAAGPHK